MWPKSFLRGQPTEWVSVEGHVIPNTVGLCLTHHEHVTGVPGGGHLAAIRWNSNLELLEWWSVGEDKELHDRGPLRSQDFVPKAPEAARVRREEGLCPSCGRPPKKEAKPLPRRATKTWVVSVPDDSEKGSEVLDTYIEDLGHLMGFDFNARLLRFHVLVPALEYVMQDRYEFVKEYLGEDA